MTWDRERSTLQDCKLLEGSYPTERGWWKVEAIKRWTLSLSLNFQSAAAGLFICDLNTAKVALSNTCATFMVSVSSVTKHLFSFDFPLHTSYSKIGSSLYNTNLGGGITGVWRLDKIKVCDTLTKGQTEAWNFLQIKHKSIPWLQQKISSK